MCEILYVTIFFFKYVIKIMFIFDLLILVHRHFLPL